jgi:hypothetical protein
MQGHFAADSARASAVRPHPEHEKFLEENWLFEAITETYIPLIQIMEGWQKDGMKTRLTMSISPPLCAMLLDPMLQDRYTAHLDGLIQLAESEIHRTHWDAPYRELAWMYHRRFTSMRETYFDYGRNLVGAFRRFQDDGLLEIATCAATHALLPLLADDPPSLRAQIFVARDYHRACFGRDPRGIWLPECAFVEGIEKVLQEANIRWFVTETHGILHARPRPRYGVFAPSSRPTAWPRSGATSSPPARSGANSAATPATSGTAIFTATSDSTWILITSNLICPPPTRAASPASNTIASPATRWKSKSMTAPPRCARPTNTPVPFPGIARRAVRQTGSDSWTVRPRSLALRRRIVRPLVV